MKAGVNTSPKPSVNNTHIAHINETLISYYLADEKWLDTDAEQCYQSKICKLSKDEYDAVYQKSYAMAQGFLGWASNNQYKKIENVWWTGIKPISEIMNDDTIDNITNPSDVLVKFKTGGYLGLSAKCSKNTCKVPFKNLGMGSIESHFGFPLNHIKEQMVADAIQKFGLPSKGVDMKKFIRSNPALQKETRAFARTLLKEVNTEFYNSLLYVGDDEIKDFVERKIMNITTSLPYIKVTGYGDDNKVKIENPLQHKIKNLGFEVLGDSSIKFFDGDKALFLLTWKWNSEPLTASLKTSAV